MDDRLILVIDAGTTSTRVVLFGTDGAVHGLAQAELSQSFPASGHVEQDAEEIWDRTLACLRKVVAAAKDPTHIAGIGITNQRETVIFWDKRTGKALAPAIVWQDRRTAEACAALREAGHEPLIQQRTGLLLDPYFSASKIGWALDHWPQLRAAGDALAVGTVDSWIVAKLTDGLHISDASNASRTSLMNIDSGTWDEDLLGLFDMDRNILPEITDNIGNFATCDLTLFGLALPICGMAGDQQAAAIGQNCLEPGQSKATFGTGAFILASTGQVRPSSANRLLSTIAWQADGVRHYALEGSIFVAGSLIKWLRDTLCLIGSASESEALARSVADNGGVYLVPAMTGLGAPHWRPDARGLIAGLSLGSGRAHIVRAALEAMTYQVHDLKKAFADDGAPWSELRIDGGMAANDWMAQDIADMLDIPVTRPDFIETTAKGAAMLAAVGAGLYPDLPTACARMVGGTQRFLPAMQENVRSDRLRGWRDALDRTLR